MNCGLCGVPIKLLSTEPDRAFCSGCEARIKGFSESAPGTAVKYSIKPHHDPSIDSDGRNQNR